MEFCRNLDWLMHLRLYNICWKLQCVKHNKCWIGICFITMLICCSQSFTWIFCRLKIQEYYISFVVDWFWWNAIEVNVPTAFF